MLIHYLEISVLNFQIKIEKEAKDLIIDFIKELKVLNENLSDIKEMVAPILGFKVIKK